MSSDSDLMDRLSPTTEPEHPIVTVMKRLLGGADVSVDERIARAKRGDFAKGKIVDPEHTTREDDDVANLDSSPQRQEYRSIRI